MRPSKALAGFFLSKFSVSCLQTDMGCCPWWLPLAPAEQSIQLFICHSSRLRHCYHYLQDNIYNESLFISIYSGNQSKSQEKGWANWYCLSLFTSHVVSTSRAEHTTSYRGRATTSFIPYHQLKTWSLLSKDNQSKSLEKVWENWNCLSLVTSHVVGTGRAEHTTSYMSYKQMKTLSSFTTRQPIQILKKSVTSVFFVIDHFSCH